MKRAENGMILDPITLHKDSRVEDAFGIMKEFNIGGIPVVNNENELVGIVTNRDLRFEKNINLPIEDVMTKENLVTTTEFTDFEKAAEILQKHRIEKLPVVDEKNKLIGLITYKDIIKILARPNAEKDSRGRLRVASAVGIAENTMERVDALVKAGVDALVVDTAHGHTKSVMDIAKKSKKAILR